MVEATATFAGVRIAKAEQFLRSAASAQDRADWDASVSDAILAGIAACDAYLAAEHGLRSTGPHHKLAALVRKQGGPGVAKQAEALGRLLSLKSDSQYGERLFGAREARDCIARAERLLEWARSSVKGART